MKNFKILMLACIIAGSNALAQTTTNIFSDNFPGTIMSSANWYIPTWVSATDGTFNGRTQYRCTNSPSPLPSVVSGSANINLDTYNPTGSSFFGTDVITNKKFSPGEFGLIFTVCAKIKNPGCGGIVGGIFLYNNPEPSSASPHDEIDFELLTNSLTAIQTNIYDNIPLGAGYPKFRAITDSITDVHTYVIEWLPTEVLWYLDGTLIRDTNLSIMDTMHLHLNMYAPAANWSAAYNACLQPTDASADTTYTMLVCSVRVDSLLEPASGPGAGCFCSAATSVPNIIKQNPVTLYPNPATTSLTIQSTNQPINHVAISNLIGQTVCKHEYNTLPSASLRTGSVQVDVSDLPAGVYFVKVNGSEVRKFVKE